MQQNITNDDVAKQEVTKKIIAHGHHIMLPLVPGSTPLQLKKKENSISGDVQAIENVTNFLIRNVLNG
jgi:hypothetical protein